MSGQTGSIPQAIELLSARYRPHRVILHVQWRTKVAWLKGQGSPFVTGYEQADTPERFAAAPHVVKPLTGGECCDATIALVETTR